MSNNTKKEADLGNDRIGGLLFKLALPAILAQIINLLYNLVDRMYIGHIPGEGSAALTGVGVTMPVIMCISAFAALFLLEYRYIQVYQEDEQVFRYDMFVHLLRCPLMSSYKDLQDWLFLLYL